MINTYNESSLHKTLKIMYSSDGGKLEVLLDGFIYDIVIDKNEQKNEKIIIEIQNQNLSKLLAKSLKALECGRKIKIVFTIPAEKTIILQDKEGNIISKRKSPKKQNIYSLFRELTGIYSILLEKNFTLEVLLIDLLEIREKQETFIQSANNRRRFKKNWIKKDKKLLEILEKYTFNKKQDYLALLPKNLPFEFSAKELQTALKMEKTTKGKANINANLILWVLEKMKLVNLKRTEGRKKIWEFSNSLLL